MAIQKVMGDGVVGGTCPPKLFSQEGGPLREFGPIFKIFHPSFHQISGHVVRF